MTTKTNPFRLNSKKKPTKNKEKCQENDPKDYTCMHVRY